MKATFIVNSIAAKQQGKDWRPALEFLTTCTNFAAELALTETEGHAIALSEEAVKSGTDLLVAVGGDGTVNECVNGILTEERSKRPLFGVIPLGSGCDFIRSVGIPRNPLQAAVLLQRLQKKRMDVGKVEFLNFSKINTKRYFINVADVGAGGVVVKHAAKAPRIFGKRPNYLWGMLSAITAYSPKNVILRTDGSSPKSMRVRNVVFANGKYFGRGFKVAPHAETNDNLLDVIVLGDYSTAESIWHLPKMYSGTHVSLDKIQELRASRVEVSSGEEVLLELDGELAGMVPACFEIVPGALELVC